MTTDELTLQEPDPLIKVRLWDAVIAIACNTAGDIELSGERTDVVGLLTRYIHQDLLLRGRTQGDALRVALKIATKFDAEIIDFNGVRASMRSGWVRLLRTNLMGDPAQSFGARMHEFHTWRGLAVTIAAGSHHVLHSGGPTNGASFDLSDPEYLIVWPTNKKRWRARWELLTTISFTYFEPPSDWLAERIMAQTTGQRLHADSSGQEPNKSQT